MVGLSLGWDDSIRPVGAHTSPPANENKRKRRINDFFGGGGASEPVSNRRSLASPSSSNKRAKLHSPRATAVPLRRRLESLGHNQLLDLVESLVQNHPETHQSLRRLVPEITVERALRMLKEYHQRILDGLPYKDDPRGDYAYLRVEPHLRSFFEALADYTAAFLPAHSAENTVSGQALIFLDGATELIHSLPEWTSPVNNVLRNRAYHEIAQAWAIVLRGRQGSMSFVLGEAAAWETRLTTHNRRADGRLGEALDAFTSVCEPLGGIRTTDIVC